MKERPILFKARLVRALLAGAKTVTRRPVKSVLGFGNVTEFQPSGTRGYDWQFRDAEMRWHDLRADAALAACPYGVPGDVLWVRETWCRKADPITSRATDEAFYLATDKCEFLDDGDGYPVENKDGSWASPWRPSIHMPRWACRILLRVTDVSIARVQSITPLDVLSEGVTVGALLRDKERLAAFGAGWDGIYGKDDALRWDANPYVWVVRFERIAL